MNNKGFTLIELIATIALLVIISVISFVSINSVIKQSKVNDCENLVKNIKSATKEYVSDNRYNADFVESIPPVMLVSITAETLVNNLYLTSPIKNPFNNEDMELSKIRAEVSLNSDYTVDNITIKNNINNTVDCSTNQW